MEKRYLFWSDAHNRMSGYNTIKADDGKIIAYTSFCSDEVYKHKDKRIIREMTREEFDRCMNSIKSYRKESFYY